MSFKLQACESGVGTSEGGAPIEDNLLYSSFYLLPITRLFFTSSGGVYSSQGLSRLCCTALTSSTASAAAHMLPYLSFRQATSKTDEHNINERKLAEPGSMQRLLEIFGMNNSPPIANERGSVSLQDVQVD